MYGKSTIRIQGTEEASNNSAIALCWDSHSKWEESASILTINPSDHPEIDNIHVTNCVATVTRKADPMLRFYNNPKLSDLTVIISDVGIMHVHRVVLSAHSDFFFTMFSSEFGEEASSSEIYIEDGIIARDIISYFYGKPLLFDTCEKFAGAILLADKWQCHALMESLMSIAISNARFTQSFLVYHTVRSLKNSIKGNKLELILDAIATNIYNSLFLPEDLTSLKHVSPSCMTCFMKRIAKLGSVYRIKITDFPFLVLDKWYVSKSSFHEGDGVDDTIKKCVEMLMPVFELHGFHCVRFSSNIQHVLGGEANWMSPQHFNSGTVQTTFNCKIMRDFFSKMVPGIGNHGDAMGNPIRKWWSSSPLSPLNAMLNPYCEVSTGVVSVDLSGHTVSAEDIPKETRCELVSFASQHIRRKKQAIIKIAFPIKYEDDDSSELSLDNNEDEEDGGDNYIERIAHDIITEAVIETNPTRMKHIFDNDNGPPSAPKEAKIESLLIVNRSWQNHRKFKITHLMLAGMCEFMTNLRVLHLENANLGNSISCYMGMVQEIKNLKVLSMYNCVVTRKETLDEVRVMQLDHLLWPKNLECLIVSDDSRSLDLSRVIANITTCKIPNVSLYNPSLTEPTIRGVIEYIKRSEKVGHHCRVEHLVLAGTNAMVSEDCLFQRYYPERYTLIKRGNLGDGYMLVDTHMGISPQNGTGIATDYLVKL